MENDWENFDKESKLIIKELTKDNEIFSKLIVKLNSAKESLGKNTKLIIALEGLNK